MGDFSTHVCLLCLELTPSCDSKLIKDLKKETLKYLPINIDCYISISDYVLCKRCLKEVQDWLDFKTRCSITMNANFKTAIKDKFLHVMSSGSACQKNSRGCSLCMSLTEVEAFNCTTDQKDAVLLKDIITICFPDMDLNADLAILLCQPCLSSMKTYYKFMKSCQEVKQGITHFRQLSPHGTAGRVILEDVLKFKKCNVLDKPSIIKKENLDVDNVAENAMKCFENEGTASIKCEEIDIKDEVDEGVSANDSHQLDDCDSSEEDGFSKTTTKEQNNFDPKHPHSPKRLTNLKNAQTHPDNEQYYCTSCGFVTDAKLLFQDHMMTHTGTTHKYGCRKCPYETDYHLKLVRHNAKHKEHKCLVCPATYKNSSSLAKHRRMQHKNTVKMYKCQECSFSSKYKHSLISHNVVHVDPKVAHKFKCEKCPFWTKWKGVLKRHMAYHSHKQSPHRHSCDQCDYSSKSEAKLLQHRLVHQADGERQLYKCKLCRYEAEQFRSVKIHMMRTHPVPSRIPRFKCDHCPYKTAVKGHLLSHMRWRHDNKDQRPYKCEVCEFSTWGKSHLKYHQVTHRELGEAMWYYCAVCDYKTMYKDDLDCHAMNCAKRTEDTDNKNEK